MSDHIQQYVGMDIEITYDGKRCIHAAECVRGLPAVFDSNNRPWIDPDAAPPDAIAAVIHRCPSGALHYSRRDGGDEEPVSIRNRMLATPDGPLFVRGRMRIVRPDGELVVEDVRAALCRCGASRNKPFCDNSHLRIGFQGSSAVEDNQATTEPVEDHGVLEIVPSTNGPYRLKGHFEILSADGRSLYRGRRAALCRCGASGTKPFCDESHVRIGFVSE